MKKVISIVILLFLAGCSSMSYQNENKKDELISVSYKKVLASQSLERKDTISATYDSYTFFLIPNDRWARINSNKIREMYSAFAEFGEAIGTKDLAIWFNHEGKTDIQRSEDFAKLFNLDINSGPYVVYVRPKNPIAKKLLILSSKDFKAIKIARDTLEQMATEEAYDIVIINFMELGIDDAMAVLSNLKSNIRHEESVRPISNDITIKVIVQKVSCLKNKIMNFVNTKKIAVGVKAVTLEVEFWDKPKDCKLLL